MNPAFRLSQWWRLPRSSRYLFWLLLAGLPAVSVSLRLLGFRRTLAVVERVSHRRHPRSATAADVAAGHDLARLCAIAGRHGLFPATCLRQALLVHGLLRRRGLPPVLRLGVRRKDASPDMHAWVELNGVALGETELAHTPFQTLSGKEDPLSHAATPDD